MHDSFNYQLLNKPKLKALPKPGKGVRLSQNPSINSSIPQIPGKPSSPELDMAFSHNFHNFLPRSTIADRQLPERLKPRESAALDPDEEEENHLTDIVMVAEFSEQEGPRPLIILSEGYDETLFDANSFAVRIMSVDSSAPPSVGVTGDNNDDDPIFYGGQDVSFRLAQDSVGIHLETADNRVVSHVRHFTLYDLEARGFVRPFCVAYITQNSDKLVRRHDLIDAKFNEATSAFKRGNFHQFSRELQKRLVDLGFTKGRKIEWDQVSGCYHKIWDYHRCTWC